MNILKLAAVLSLDGSKFKAGMKEAEVSARNFGRDVSGAIKGQLAAVFGGAALVAFTKNAFEAAESIKDMASQSRMTTEEVQRLTAAAANTGLQWTDIANAERQFNQRRKDAAEGNEELRQSFARLGADLTDLQNPQLRFVDFLTKARDAMGKMGASDRATAVNDLFDTLGRVGPKLEEFLVAVKAASKEKIVSDESIENLDQAKKKIDEIKRETKAGFMDWLAERIFYGAVSGPTTPNYMGMGGGMMPNAPSASTAPAPKPQSTYTDAELRAMQAGGPMFQDKAATQRNLDLLKAQAELEEAIFKFKLEQMNATERRLTLEKQLETQLGFIAALEDMGDVQGAAEERVKALGMLSALTNQKGDALDVSQLVRVGQLPGRDSLPASGESPVVTLAKEQLGVQKRTANAVEQIARNKGATIKGAP